MSSSPSILDSCRTEYVLKVVKMSIILASRRWKVSNFPKIYISLNSNCFSFGSCLSFCFILWKQFWYSLKWNAETEERENTGKIDRILLQQGRRRCQGPIANPFTLPPRNFLIRQPGASPFALLWSSKLLIARNAPQRGRLGTSVPSRWEQPHSVSTSPFARKKLKGNYLALVLFVPSVLSMASGEQVPREDGISGCIF